MALLQNIATTINKEFQSVEIIWVFIKSSYTNLLYCKIYSTLESDNMFNILNGN